MKSSKLPGMLSVESKKGLDYPADDESRGRDRSHESGKSDVMGAVNELHPLPGRGNHQDGTNLLLREVKL